MTLLLTIQSFLLQAHEQIVISKQTAGTPKGFFGAILQFYWTNKIFTVAQVWMKQAKDVVIKVCVKMQFSYLVCFHAKSIVS